MAVSPNSVVTKVFGIYKHVSSLRRRRTTDSQRSKESVAGQNLARQGLNGTRK